jgi:GDPmannose 4,6-dehydratase
MRALITGVTGQDGFYLSKLLLEKGYLVFGLVRRSAQGEEIPEGIEVLSGDVTDPLNLDRIYADARPDETYNLAAMSHVGESFKVPAATIQTNTLGCLYLLECVRKYGGKFYQASSSEMFGDSPAPQNEKTPFRPRSPYAISKAAAYWLTVNYREAYGLHASNGILFNHESPRRGEDFVTRKVCIAVARIARGLQEKLLLGNLDAVRDWGHAEDFTFGMWQIMQRDPGDFVLATGKSRSVRELLDVAFRVVGIRDWSGYVEVSSKLYRPTEVENLCGDARTSSFWETTLSFEDMISEMVLCELARLS